MTTIPDPKTKSRGRTDIKLRKSYNKEQLGALVEYYLGGSMGEGVLTGPIDLHELKSDVDMAYNVTCLLLSNRLTEKKKLFEQEIYTFLDKVN
ncbi:hypothetical protein niasHT_018309 [Heterodera trifolii]|uniref:Uncharacterized protein n=1 Tax=Heterodera trifolii TaxID=157864 RepID=A0ABD2LG45_9BILA